MKKASEKRGQEEIPAETQAELCAWQQEQEGELTTLRAHCQGRHKQLEDIINKLSRSSSSHFLSVVPKFHKTKLLKSAFFINSLQAEHDHFQGWLQQREKLPEQRENLRQVHKDFLKER